MVCHVCGKGATAQCTKCNRFSYNDHLDNSMIYYAGATLWCTSCREEAGKSLTDADRKRIEDNVAARLRRRCAFCDRIDPGAHSPQYRHIPNKNGYIAASLGGYGKIRLAPFASRFLQGPRHHLGRRCPWLQEQDVPCVEEM